MLTSTKLLAHHSQHGKIEMGQDILKGRDKPNLGPASPFPEKQVILDAHFNHLIHQPNQYPSPSLTQTIGILSQVDRFDLDITIRQASWPLQSLALSST